MTVLEGRTYTETELSAHADALPIDRRRLLLLLGGFLVACGGRSGGDLPSRLGLDREMESWLATLSHAQQAQLLSALEGDTAAIPGALDTLVRLLGPRSRLFAYVGYPEATDKMTLCDGLFRE